MLRKFLLITSFSLAMILTGTLQAQEHQVTLPSKGVSSLVEFKSLPILEEGRIKPLETYAKNILLRFSGRRSFNRKPAIDWLARLVFMPETTQEDKVFLINHPDIPAALGMMPEKRRRYSFSQLEKNQEKLLELAQAAFDIDEKSRSIVENEIIRIYANFTLYMGLGHSFQFAYPNASFSIFEDETFEKLGLQKDRRHFSFLEIASMVGKMESVLQAHRSKDEAEWGSFEKESMKLLSNLFQWSVFYSNLPFTIIPSQFPDEEIWLSPWDTISEQFLDGSARNEITILANLANAYRLGNQIEFDRATHLFKGSIQGRGGARYSRASKYLNLELLYNKLNPFFWLLLAYFFAFVFYMGFLLSGKKIFCNIGLEIVLISALFHFIALGMRIVILGRPPVTSLYETFIFVSAISVFLGIVMEFLSRKGLGVLVASVAGFLLLVIASKYSAEGDTLKVLVAVLNTNFWLSIHVPTITSGYAACCVAGILGHIYLFQALLKPKDKKQLQNTYRNLMGILGLGLTLTFFGTCLGGIWADQSWGRFWGWDPKENGALMIALWCAIIFHARMGGMIEALGTAVCAVLGLIVVMWAWFGVNLLSVGLHSYGFTNGIAMSLSIYVFIEILFLVITVPVIRGKQNKLK